MNKIIKTIKEHYLICITLVLVALIRFTANIPVLLLSDSVKFIIPDQYIISQDSSTIWNFLNFSLLLRMLNYWLQSNFQNDLSVLINLNKLLSLASTVLIYLIVFAKSRNKILSLISAAIFSLSPALLYIENAVMAEAIFIFWLLLFTYLLLMIINQSNQNKILMLSVGIGLIAGLAEMTKQTADNWIFLICLVLFSLGVYDFLKSKKNKYILVAILIYLCSYVPKIPAYIENSKILGHFDIGLSHTIDSGRGVLLWSLTEEMIYSNPSTSYPWLTNYIIALTEQIKRQISVNDKNANTRPLLIAISQINVAGRQGQLTNPYTGELISTEEWSKICVKYWKEVSFSQPSLLLKRILNNSFVNLFFKEDLGLFIWENSLRQGVDFQPIQFTKVPFSFNSQIDPNLLKQNTKPNILSVTNNQVSKVREYYSYFTLNDNDHYYVMVNMDTPYAFKLAINSFSIWWQKIWTWIPWVYFVAPLFLISIFIYFFLRQYDLFDIYVLSSALYFSLLPLLMSTAEARYRLQFMPFMIIFIAITFFKIWNKQKLKIEKIKNIGHNIN